MMDYVLKAYQIYWAISGEKKEGPTLLSQNVEGIDSLGALLSYFRIKSKKPANFFLIFEISRDISEPKDENIASFRK